MGYCIQLKDSKFTIKNENIDKALDAMIQLGDGSNNEDASGGRLGGKTRWFAWMNLANPSEWSSIQRASRDWRYPMDVDINGDVIGISFIGEKIGQEQLMFETIAPFVEAGSFLDFIGEDGAQWRLEFNGKTMLRRQGKPIEFEDM